MRMTRLWFFQIITGTLIFVLVIVQLILIHLRSILRFFGVETAGLSPAVNPANQGIWLGFLVFLAAIILIHALIGLRQTALELGTSARKSKVITWTIAASGFALLLGITALLVS